MSNAPPHPTATLPPDTETPLYPPRFHWLKWFALIIAAAWLFAIGVRLVAGYVAKHRLDALVAEIRAAGEPILPEDFDTEPVPDEQNAAVYLRNAAAAFTFPTTIPPIIDIDLLLQEPGGLGGDPRAEALLATNGAALALIHEARTKPYAVWPTLLRRPLGFTMRNIGLGGHRNLGRLESVAALYHHDRGDESRVIEHLIDGLAAADALYEMPGGMVQMTATATIALELRTMEGIVWNMRIDCGAGSPNAATPDQLSALIAALLDDEPRQRACTATGLLDRAANYDLVASFCDGTISSPSVLFLSPPWSRRDEVALRWCASPIWRADGVKLLQGMNACLLAQREHTYPKTIALRSPQLSPPSRNDFLEQSLFVVRKIHDPIMLMKNMARSTFATVAKRRMAAIAVAIQEYRCVEGDMPDDLAKLVPDYLPQLPSDPFTLDQVSFRYVPRGEAPKLYSIGPNLKDDGGAHEYSPLPEAPDDIAFRLGPEQNKHGDP